MLSFLRNAQGMSQHQSLSVQNQRIQEKAHHYLPYPDQIPHMHHQAAQYPQAASDNQ